MIHISQSVQSELEVHAIEEHPHECCGYITGTDDPDSWVVHRCRNIQNELHKKYPEQYPRDARTAYVFSPEDMEQLFLGTFDRPDERVIGFYHSHPEHTAYFSDKDRSEALIDWIEPEPFYLVISVISKEIRDIKAFSWQEGTKTFSEVHIIYDTIRTEGD